MLTVAQAAVRAGCSKSLVRAWISEGTLPCFRLGAKGRRGKVMISPDDLDALLQSFRTTNQPVARKPPPKVRPKLSFKHIRV